LLCELKSRHEDGLAGYLDHIDLEDIIKHVRARDPNLVLTNFTETACVGSSFKALEAEMRRLTAGTDTSKKRFYYDVTKRKPGVPHYMDDPVVTWEYVCDKMYSRRSAQR
jgi:hypothetical protein